ncbi:MAG: AraC family transcriptional regulator [Spirochaetes bacterium]|nr:AraC family transcriptional regulator [Spirochaetota bacterium]
MEFIYFAAILQMAFLLVLLIRRRREPGMLYFLALIAVCAFGIFIGYLYATRRILELPNLARMGFPAAALMGPLLYLAFRNFWHAEKKLRWGDLLFFIVPLAEVVYLVPFFAASLETKVRYLTEDMREIHADCLVLLYVTLLQNFLLAGFGWFSFYRKSRPAAVYSSPTEARRLARILNATSICVAVVLCAFFAVSLIDRNLLNSNILGAGISLLVIAMGYLILWGFIDPALVAEIAAAPKYAKAALGESELKAIGARIDAAFSAQKCHRDNELTLAKLAGIIGEPVSAVSQVLARHHDKTFYELLSEYRLQEFTALAQSQREASVLELAYRSGFNSKATFNAAFRRKYNLTPQEWRRQT